MRRSRPGFDQLLNQTTNLDSAHNFLQFALYHQQHSTDILHSTVTPFATPTYPYSITDFAFGADIPHTSLTGNALAGMMANVDSTRSIRMSPALSANIQSTRFETPPRNTQPLDLLPPLRPPKRTVSYGGNQDVDPENEDKNLDSSLRRRISSLLKIRPAKRTRNNPPPPPPPPPPQRRSANRRHADSQAVRSFRQVLRAPAIDEDVVTAEVLRAPAIDEDVVTAVSAQDGKDIFPLLMLPFEVREKILRYILVSDKPVYVKRLWTEQVRSIRRNTRGRGHGGNGDKSEEEYTNKTTILRTSRQMLAEGSLLLYSQNQFVYLLRDPIHAMVDFASMLKEAQKKSPKKIEGRNKRKRKADSQYGLYEINIAKYGHLLRHLSIELEPNRSGTQYRELMEQALDVLTSSDRRGRYLLAGQIVDGKTPRIFLHTLTITVSPENDQGRPGSGSVSKNSSQESRSPYSSAIELFDSRSLVMHALSRIDTQFLRINMHINDGPHNDNEGDDEFALNTGTRKRHLETTIDMRFLPRHTKQVNDHLMKEQRAKRGEEAQTALQTLKIRMYEGFENPDRVVVDGLWEDNSAADVRRKKERAEFEARLEGDARRQNDDEESSSNEDSDEDENDDDDYESRPKKRKLTTRGRGRYGDSLLISVRRVADGLVVSRS
ncbi:hypothetical protein NEUTE1DRAFT_98304 [Neurospora tetrasperma FGSC 2508]|uniref:F-box domain-containing protein n=1 Tax=Neurospora tetrasperma (strain FGSC 2508 / ATCC MYA-4615 / P0657) TaxID=510951 RepID=F8MBV5_NEUT8|nr:uncharacterized protein NEUTE1DRAFT_98304 [Neurospora tetrasperma FGSC 2508]EGO61164.1 hypothetical protein NEUTE1DRAFT_98304 [Neurospora tetrasperma FGSC 2508]